MWCYIEFMQKVFVIFVLILLGSSFSLFVSAKTVALSDEQLKKIIENAVSWLQNAQEENGHFRYEYMPFWDRYVDDDNVVRQAGAFYVLGEVFVKMPGGFDLGANLEKAVVYFAKNSIESKFNGYEFKCLLKTEDTCTLGGTSLLLVGLLDLVSADGSLKSKYEGEIEDYINFILAMEISDAGFRDKYVPGAGGKQSDAESAFSNGEALLALVRYYLYNPSEELKEVIDDGLKYFVRIYRQEFDPNFYLWGMAALKDWYKLFPEEKYYDFVKDYTDWRMERHKDLRTSSRNRCAYIEGVVSAFSVLESEATTEAEYKYLGEIDFWLNKSQSLQLKKKDTIKIVFGDKGAKILVIKKPSKALGGFLTSFSEPFQRIDFTQHCLSAYLQKLVD